MPTPTREAFNEEIQNFKKRYGGKLKNLLDKTKHPEEAQEFWDNPVIRSYLSRSDIEFKGSHPDLSSELDKYELKIYEHFPKAIAYRNALINTLEFTGGGHETGELSDYFRKLSQSNDIEVRGLGDIYNIANDVYTRFLKASPPENKPRFILSPNWKDTHATTCLTILDDATQKPLVTIFVNSWQHEPYFDYMKQRINRPIKRMDLYRGSEKAYEKAIKQIEIAITQICRDDFGVNLEQEKFSERRIWKTADEKTVFVLDPDDRVKFSDPELDALEREAEVLYHVAKDRDGKLIMESLQQKNIPFIDASHHLQTAVGDRSCTLYGLNFIQALTKFLENPENANQMYELAKKVKTDPKAGKSLTQMIQEDLKSYLPEYYTENGDERTPKDISDFHVKQRWDVGGQSIPKEIPELKSSLPKALRAQRDKYFQLIDEIQVLSQFCEEKGNKAEHQVMNQLCHDLLRVGEKFFNSIGSQDTFEWRQNSFKTFSDDVVTYVRKSDKHFCKSGIWYDYIRPVLKAIMSFLLDIAVFFSMITPATKTKQLESTFESLPDKNVRKAYLKLSIAQRLIDKEKGLIKDIEEAIEPQKDIDEKIKPKK